jgi:hypothetical protein
MRAPLPTWISLRAIVAFLAAGVIGTPIWLTWEDFPEKHGYKPMLDDAINKVTLGDYSFLLDWLTSNFAAGFAVASFLFGCWDIVSRIWRAAAASRFPSGVHVSEMLISAEHLDRDHYLTITVCGFNVSGETIAINRVRGTISCYEERVDGTLGTFAELPTATVLHDEVRTVDIADFSPLRVVLHQQVPAPAADRLSSMLALGSPVQLDFDRCDVVVQVAGAPRRTARLPLWSGVVLTRHPASLTVARVFGVSGVVSNETRVTTSS